jgi:hypothetical protein
VTLSLASQQGDVVRPSHMSVERRCTVRQGVNDEMPRDEIGRRLVAAGEFASQVFASVDESGAFGNEDDFRHGQALPPVSSTALSVGTACVGSTAQDEQFIAELGERS